MIAGPKTTFQCSADLNFYALTPPRQCQRVKAKGILAVEGLYFPSIISRPGQSQWLLYKHLCHSLINWLSHIFPPTALRGRHAKTVGDSSSSYKIDYGIGIKNFLNPEGHQNCISGSKITAILLKGWILPICGKILIGQWVQNKRNKSPCVCLSELCTCIVHIVYRQCIVKNVCTH